MQFIVGHYGGRLLGMRRGTGLRTFAFAVGIYNYGYIPIPLVDQLFGADALAVLFVHNIGCELAIWTVGMMVMVSANDLMSVYIGLELLSLSLYVLTALTFRPTVGRAAAVPRKVRRIMSGADGAAPTRRRR